MRLLFDTIRHFVNVLQHVQKLVFGQRKNKKDSVHIRLL
jgi:hypothetical protein